MARVTGFLTALIAGLAISGSALSQSALSGPSSIPPIMAENISKLHDVSWKMACALKRIDCSKLPMPKVGYGLLQAEYGTYRVNSDIVLIDLRLLGQEFGTTVIIHEMLHYIQDRQRPLSGGLITHEQSCIDEEEAFTLVFAMAIQTNLAVGDTRLMNWSEVKRRYPGCAPALLKPYRYASWE